MGLSNVTGASSILQPGVCTSSTRPASPYDGQVIYETDTDKVAVYDSSSWVYKTGTSHVAPALVLISTTTIGTTVTSVALTNVFSATYDNYRIVLSGGTASTTSDGSFILGATTANYYTAFSYNGFVSPYSGTFTGAGNIASSSSVFSYSANGINSVIDIFSPFSTARTGYHFTSVTLATTGNRWQGSGFQDSATSFTGITFSTQGGHTITGGTIKVYGYQNS